MLKANFECDKCGAATIVDQPENEITNKAGYKSVFPKFFRDNLRGMDDDCIEDYPEMLLCVCGGCHDVYKKLFNDGKVAFNQLIIDFFKIKKGK